MDSAVAKAVKVLTTLGVPPLLVRRGELVAEAAADLVDEIESLDVPVDRECVLAAAVLHDARGEDALLAAGVAPQIARCCRARASWHGPELSLEELLIELAHHLWKGSRAGELELRVIDRIAVGRGQSRWDVFEQLDARFEAIARIGPARLARQE